MIHDIQRLIDQSGVSTVSIAFYDMETRSRMLIQPDLSYHAASTIKLCIMMELYRQAEERAFWLDDYLTVHNVFRSIADGEPYSLLTHNDSDTDIYKHIGSVIPARDLIFRMITLSSNLATNILIERVTAARVTQFMKKLGARDLLILRGVEDYRAYEQGLNNRASARSLMRILVRLAERSVVSPAASEEMLKIMCQQQFREGIPALLPGKIQIAHKTGSNEYLYHDAGIVYPPRRKPYILVVMTQGLHEETEAPLLTAEISRFIYDKIAQ